MHSHGAPSLLDMIPIGKRLFLSTFSRVEVVHIKRCRNHWEHSYSMFSCGHPALYVFSLLLVELRIFPKRLVLQDMRSISHRLYAPSDRHDMECLEAASSV